MATLLPGITARTLETPRLRANILEREGASDGTVVVFIHGNVSSSLFWQPLMLDLPDNIRPIAVDLRGFGDSETAPVDATRGLRDFSDDVLAVLDELGIASAHFVGWSMGAGVVMQVMLDRPDVVASVTLSAPVSPYGFGGTTADGSILSNGAGTGGGGANPDFVAALAAGDTSDASPTSPRQVFRATYVAAGYESGLEDLWVESMLSTKTGEDNYPGDSGENAAWPGFGPGERGVLNTMTPRPLQRDGDRRSRPQTSGALDPGGCRRDRQRPVVLRPEHPRPGRGDSRVARGGCCTAAADGEPDQTGV